MTAPMSFKDGARFYDSNKGDFCTIRHIIHGPTSTQIHVYQVFGDRDRALRWRGGIWLQGLRDSPEFFVRNLGVWDSRKGLVLLGGNDPGSLDHLMETQSR